VVVPEDTGPIEAAPVNVGLLVAASVYNSHTKGYNCWFIVGLFKCDCQGIVFFYCFLLRNGRLIS
jgi:hypothetical protein